jgi:ABC-2 type transport system ATP-binding protein
VNAHQGGSYAVEVSGLGKQYPSGHVALREISFTAELGCVAALIGPNGAGKTTTIRILTARMKPSAGSASVLGLDVKSQPVEVRRHIGVVTQENSLDRSLTGSEVLYFHGRYFGLSKKAARIER